MKNDAIIFLIIFLIGLFTFGVIIPTIPNISYSNISEGTIIDKYANGQANATFHFVISLDTEKNRTKDLIVSHTIYEQYNINDKIRAQHSILGKVQYISRIN